MTHVRPRQCFAIFTVCTVLNGLFAKFWAVIGRLFSSTGLHYWDDDTAYWNLLDSYSLVYVVAENYCLPTLKRDALEKMRHRLETHTPIRGVTNAMTNIWQSTTSDDKDAPALLVAHCVKHIKSFL